MQPVRYSAVGAKVLGACAVVLLLLYACRQVDETTSPITAGVVKPVKIALFYVCDNKFRVTNANPTAVTVTYKVVNTAEQGTLNLPAKQAGVPSETVFTTQNTGTVQIYVGTTLVDAQTNDGVSCSPTPPPPPPPPPPPEATVGQWSSVIPAPIVQLHLHLN